MKIKPKKEEPKGELTVSENEETLTEEQPQSEEESKPQAEEKEVE